MNDPAIEGKLNRWMPKIIDGNRRALNSLMRDGWMLDLLRRIAEWAERRKKIAFDEERGTAIQEIVAARIREKLHQIKNPNKVSWSKCVAKWSYVVAARLCEDIRKRNARLAVDYDLRMSELVSTLPSPEEELERKEQAPLRRKLVSKIHETALRARAGAEPEERRILDLWAEGDTLTQIKEKTGIPLSTVHRKLKEIQKAIFEGVREGIVEERGEASVKESGVEKDLQEVVQDRGHLRELLANSSKEMRGRVCASRPRSGHGRARTRPPKKRRGRGRASRPPA